MEQRVANERRPDSERLESPDRRAPPSFDEAGEATSWRQRASAADAAGKAMALIGQTIRTQATILAYIDVFHLCAITAALMIPLVLVLVRRINVQTASAPIGH